MTTIALSQPSLASRIAKRRLKARAATPWPERYVNARTGKEYQPHNDDEAVFVQDDEPRYSLLKGGEGAGKSSAGIIKNLERLRRGCPGAMTSPDLEHFKKSLWPEFRLWCPWDRVVKEHQRMQAETWEPYRAFRIVFRSETGDLVPLLCGGMDDPESWEGPNLSFWHMDEARRFKNSSALKVATGRARVMVNGVPPQVYLTTTPRKHWLYEYFGPMQEDDPFAEFKRNAFIGTVPVHLNLENLDPGYLEERAQSLTKSEERVLMFAEWEDISDVEKFVNIIWWDNCKEELPALGRSEPLVLAMDAATGGETATPDSFAVVGVTRHPSRKADVAVRYCGIWLPPAGGLLDYGPIKDEVRRLCREFAVVEVAYDPHQLHDFAMTMQGEGLANFRRFKQTEERLIADRQLQDLIMSKRIAHDGNPLLRKHVDNANAKKGGDDKSKLRIVKRTQSLKVDACVALSMSCSRILYFNLG